MNINDFIIATGMTKSALAKKLEVTKASITRYCAIPPRVPEPEVMQRLIDLTGGEVDANSFFKMPSKPSRKIEAFMAKKSTTNGKRK